MNHVWFFRFSHTWTSLFPNPVSAVETQQYHNMWAILFTCHKTGPYYYCMICLLIKIFHLFPLRLSNFCGSLIFSTWRNFQYVLTYLYPGSRSHTQPHPKSYDRIPSRRGHHAPLIGRRSQPCIFQGFYLHGLISFRIFSMQFQFGQQELAPMKPCQNVSKTVILQHGLLLTVQSYSWLTEILRLTILFFQTE